MFVHRLLCVLAVCILSQGQPGASVQPSLTSDNARVYVAELPPSFELPHEDASSIWHLLETSEGDVWSSDWRSTPRWFAAQMRASPLRVLDVSEADVVFVPVDLSFWQKTEQWIVGGDAQRDHINAFMDGAQDLLPELGNLPHIVVLQVTAKSYDRSGATTDHVEDMETTLFRHENTKHFTFITMGPWLGRTSTHTELGVLPNGVHGLQTWSNIADSAHCPGCVGTVYPQTYHWSDGSAESQQGYSEFNSSVCDLKVLTAAAAFITRPNFQRVKLVEGLKEREALRDQCLGSERCQHVQWDFTIKPLAEIRRAMQAAWFSIHPIGDNIIRGALYDSMIAYALPVVFAKEVAWQLPYTDVIDYSDVISYVNPQAILPENAGSMSVIDILEGHFTKAALCRKLEALHKIRPVMQFSLTPVHNLITFANMSSIEVGEDAFTFTMKGVLRHLCRQGWQHENCTPLSIKLRVQIHI